MNIELWPQTWLEMDLERGRGLKPEDFADYSYPQGSRERYTDEGWRKFNELLPSNTGASHSALPARVNPVD